MDRRVFLTGATSALSGAFPSFAWAFNACGPVPGALGGIYEREIAEGLSQSLWVPFGPQHHARTIYALVAPWCPFCTQMANDALAGRLKFNVRAIPCDPLNISDRIKIFNVLDNPNQDNIAKFHDRRPDPTAKVENFELFNAVINYQTTTSSSVLSWIRAAFPNTFRGSPTFIITDKQGRSQPVTGYSSEQARAFESISAHVIEGQTRVTLDRILEAARFMENRVRVVIKNREARLRVFPNRSALPSECLNYDRTYLTSGSIRIDGVDWIAFQGDVGRFKGIINYGLADEFRLA